MDAQLFAPPYAQTIQVYLQSLAPGELECRDHIGVPSDDRDISNEAFERERRDVQTDPHVDAFLLEAGPQVVRSQWCRTLASGEPRHK
nr:hypothetical protein [Candidatus Palauibacter scopulicola]